LAIEVKFQNGKKYFREGEDDLWARGYVHESLYMRPSCYYCKYKTLPRISDISLGDFWGIQGVSKEDLFKGISLVMVNSAKGEDLFNKIKNDIFFERRSLDDAMKGNPSILINDFIGRKNELFFELLDSMSVSKSIKKCLENKAKIADLNPKTFIRRIYKFVRWYR
jgi:coenzyme F420-reducing hydrogenase beta subunit